MKVRTGRGIDDHLGQIDMAFGEKPACLARLTRFGESVPSMQG